MRGDGTLPDAGACAGVPRNVRSKRKFSYNFLKRLATLSSHLGEQAAMVRRRSTGTRQCSDANLCWYIGTRAFADSHPRSCRRLRRASSPLTPHPLIRNPPTIRQSHATPRTGHEARRTHPTPLPRASAFPFKVARCPSETDAARGGWRGRT